MIPAMAPPVTRRPKRIQKRVPLVQFNILVPQPVIDAFDRILEGRQRANPLVVVTRSELVREAMAEYVAKHDPKR